MNAAIIKLNALADSVWTSTQNHNLRFVGTDRVFIWCIVSGIVVGIILGSTYMNAFPGFLHT